MKKNIFLLFIGLTVLLLSVNAQDRIYWGIPGSNISSAKFDGTDIKQSVSLDDEIFDMETDFYKNVIYWGNGQTLKKANTDGTNLQTLYTGGSIGGLALDLVNNKLYFSERVNLNTIIRQCNLDGTGMKIILTSSFSYGDVYTLSISPTLQKLYWTERSLSPSANHVLRSNLDGTNIETLMTVNNFMPGLAIDEKNQKLYLSYFQDNQVMTTDMTCSTTPELVFGNSNNTFQMVVSTLENKLYFAEIRTGKIRKCNLDGTSAQDVVTGLGQIFSLSIPSVPPAPTISANETYTFELNDFLFSNVEKDLLTKIQITSNTAKGAMYVDSNNNNTVDEGEAVVLNREISKADIVAGKLKFNPFSNEYGSPYTNFKFKWFNGTSYSTFEYTQSIYVLSVVPTVSTQEVTSIGITTATGNGNFSNLGVPNPTTYGICWNTTGAPTISDSKVDNDAATASGTYTANMTGLTGNTTYYVRAYATNVAGTSYGTEVSFKTNTVTGQKGVKRLSSTIYPNPATNGFYVNAGAESCELNLCDLNGAILLTKQVTGSTYINIEWLTKGVYIARMVSAKATTEVKIIKK